MPPGLHAGDPSWAVAPPGQWHPAIPSLSPACMGPRVASSPRQRGPGCKAITRPRAPGEDLCPLNGVCSGPLPAPWRLQSPRGPTLDRRGHQTGRGTPGVRPLSLDGRDRDQTPEEPGGFGGPASPQPRRRTTSLWQTQRWQTGLKRHVFHGLVGNEKQTSSLTARTAGTDRRRRTWGPWGPC